MNLVNRIVIGLILITIILAINMTFIKPGLVQSLLNSIGLFIVVVFLNHHAK